MNNSKIKPEDVELLVKLFQLPAQVLVFDPFNALKECSFCVVNDIADLLKESKKYKTCINLSGKSIEVLSFDFIIEIGNKNHKYKAFWKEQFLCVNNKDGSLRWIQSATSKQPLFLNLYNGSGLRSDMFKSLAKVAFRFGFGTQFCSGEIKLYSKVKAYLENLYAGNNLAMFTGTIGENRKAVVAICENETAKKFIKIPISDKANLLIQQEQKHLSNLSNINFEHLEIPSTEWVKTGLSLTNVQPDFSVNTTELSQQHLKAQAELFSKTMQMKILSDVNPYQELDARFQRMKLQRNHKLPKEKVNRLINQLETLMQAFNIEILIPVAYVHGDFAPWNMYVGEDRVHLYDWELAMPEQRAFYDLFHFVFQAGILIQHLPFQKIKDKITSLKEEKLVQNMIKEHGLNFWCCYRWYLLSNCTYYLDLYTRQERIHEQAHWLIDCWLEATWDAIRMPKNEIAALQKVYS